jgi:pentatricopeptide repeat protein
MIFGHARFSSVRTSLRVSIIESQQGGEMVDMMSSKMFISYNHRDRGFVLRLDGDLRSRGVNVFLDERDIMPGESIIERVSGGIENCSHLIVVLSPNSINSLWVKREVNSALMLQLSNERGITILPLILNDCDVPLLLRDIKWADFRDGYAKGLEQILRVVGKVGYPWKRADAEQLVQRGRDLARNNNFEKAEEVFEEILKRHGAYPAAYSGLANVRYHQCRYQEGINCATKAINIDPQFPYPYYQRGLCYWGLGDTEKARVEFEKALELNPDFAYAQNMLNKLKKQQR